MSTTDQAAGKKSILHYLLIWSSPVWIVCTAMRIWCTAVRIWRNGVYSCHENLIRLPINVNKVVLTFIRVLIMVRYIDPKRGAMTKKILFLIIVLFCIISILREELLDFGPKGFLLFLRRNPETKINYCYKKWSMLICFI